MDENASSECDSAILEVQLKQQKERERQQRRKPATGRRRPQHPPPVVAAPEKKKVPQRTQKPIQQLDKDDDLDHMLERHKRTKYNKDAENTVPLEKMWGAPRAKMVQNGSLWDDDDDDEPPPPPAAKKEVAEAEDEEEEEAAEPVAAKKRRKKPPVENGKVSLSKMRNTLYAKNHVVREEPPPKLQPPPPPPPETDNSNNNNNNSDGQPDPWESQDVPHPTATRQPEVIVVSDVAKQRDQHKNRMNVLKALFKTMPPRDIKDSESYRAISLQICQQFDKLVNNRKQAEPSNSERVKGEAEMASFAMVENLMTMTKYLKSAQTDSLTTQIKLRRIEPVPRIWEDEQLRTPVAGEERACIKQTMCLVMIKFGWLMKEFITPNEYRQRQQSGFNSAAVPANTCLVCERDFLLQQYVRMKVIGYRNCQQQLVQRHCNMVNIQGEYDFSVCIGIDEDFLYPVVFNIWLGYVSTATANSGHRLVQHPQQYRAISNIYANPQAEDVHAKNAANANGLLRLGDSNDPKRIF